MPLFYERCSFLFYLWLRVVSMYVCLIRLALLIIISQSNLKLNKDIYTGFFVIFSFFNDFPLRGKKCSINKCVIYMYIYEMYHAEYCLKHFKLVSLLSVCSLTKTKSSLVSRVARYFPVNQTK